MLALLTGKINIAERRYLNAISDELLLEITF
jgi:hypothetical protein